MKLSKVAQFTAIIIAANTLSLVHAASDGVDIYSDSSQKHFHPQGKPPSKFTVDLYNQVKKSLPFEDTRDFEESKKGFIAKPPFKQIMADAGNVAWDMESYEFLLQGKEFTSINPSLQRQAVLNMAYGLYEVLPGKIYQVRGFDLANMTLIKGDTGWIIFDPLTAKETAAAALAFANEKLGKRPVVAVVFSHSHADHFGGVRGVVDEKDVQSGKVPIIAPEHFMEAAISENVFSGNAMARRIQYQYAVLLDRSPFGHVDQAIGKNVANGNTGLIAPTRLITKDFEEVTIDGVKMVFQNTPDTEAPAEMNTYFPQFKAFWAAENVTGTIHNIYTLRGAEIRNALNWSKQINNALYKFGDDVQVMFASHSWPRWGNSMDSQRADGMNFTINLVTPDNNEKYLIEMSNATLTNIVGYQAKKPTLTITVNRSDLNSVMMGTSTFEALETAGKAKFEGDRTAYEQLKSTLVKFTPNFEIMPGTLNASPTPASGNVNNTAPTYDAKPFEYVIYSAEED